MKTIIERNRGFYCAYIEDSNGIATQGSECESVQGMFEKIEVTKQIRSGL